MLTAQKQIRCTTIQIWHTAPLLVILYYRYVKFTDMKLYWYKMRFSPYHGQMRAKSKKSVKKD